MPSTPITHWPTYIQTLCRHGAFQQPADELQFIETHISRLVLGKHYVWKFKKPVDFGFLNFTRLEQRKHFCEEELRLNRRTAPTIYLEVVSINGTDAHPSIMGTGAVLDYALKMRRFDNRRTLDHLLDCDQLRDSHANKLAEVVADLHNKSERVDTQTVFAKPAHIGEWFEENFDQILPQLDDIPISKKILEIQIWGNNQLGKLSQTMIERRRSGKVRECHGDLHLGNIVETNDGIRLFDCIEFNPELRWIDTFSDVAFLVMDLYHRGSDELAVLFLNRYLQISGDYEGLQVLDYYLVYRAMVRAKIALLRLPQCEDIEKPSVFSEFTSYVDLANRFCQTHSSRLLITFGLSGSGKSSYAQVLCKQLGMIVVRSDLERKRLAGLEEADNSGSSLNRGIYIDNFTEKTYKRLEDITALALSSNHSVIVDATFLKQQQRESIRRIAVKFAADFFIVAFNAREKTLKTRILERLHHAIDASEADLNVLDMQIAGLENLNDEEQCVMIEINTESIALDSPEFINLVRKRIICNSDCSKKEY